ncbi:probable E3 ubiquitin-protein ligase XERICO [Juglans microcarpa x Juglans regia]|uniref:probable E3 ubiquitin-protein ligase XERICO n=1 Tax=Juglans microcarpa x Juglans regia TaxID=2249226 RepID=UPI001B7DFA10|nr:probable E3 ubiquitin-protein ligase XERICO [Juglans microcarpa x Juglans regia]
MGLSNFPSAAEGVLPVLVMNTVLSVTLLKNMVRSVLQVVGASGNPPNVEEDDPDGCPETENSARERRISITRFKSLRHSKSSGSSRWFPIMECCVCLCRFEAEQEVSELSCKHFFHKVCLEKWFDNYNHNTCPLCRSMD